MNNLGKINNLYYSSNQGYYVSENGKWLFIPFERNYSREELLKIIENLNLLNSQHV